MIVSRLLKPETLVSIDDGRLRLVAKALEAELMSDPAVMKVIESKLARYTKAIEGLARK